MTATRRYGAPIAITSGSDSLRSAGRAAEPGTGGLLVAAIGVVVIARGAVLLTAAAERFGGLNWPSMLASAAMMLTIQGPLARGC